MADVPKETAVDALKDTATETQEAPEMINGYELIRPFQNQNAGFSRWTCARKNSRIYFVKEFMNPKYPDPNTLEENLRKNRIRECEAFEGEKIKLYRAINETSDGNLVRIEEFFRADSHYYMATEWIQQEKISFEEIARSNLKTKLLLCRTAAHSLAALHLSNIAHSDIKDTNVIVHRTKGGKLAAKIIDFDCSFFVDKPPANEDDLGGDQLYLSPEACLFFCGEEVKLTCKMDIFALGLLFHQYMTGKLPYYDKNEYDYPHEAVLDDVKLTADTADIPLTIREIIENMLLQDPEKRSSASEVYDLLTKEYVERYPEDGRRMNGGNSASSTMRTDNNGFWHQAGDL